MQDATLAVALRAAEAFFKLTHITQEGGRWNLLGSRVSRVHLEESVAHLIGALRPDEVFFEVNL